MCNLRSKLFLNREKLLPSYIPQKMIHRREQLSHLTNIFEPLIEGEDADQAVIVGGHGSGKTLIANQVETQLAASAEMRDVELTCLHIFCRVDRTHGNIVRNIVSQVAPHLSLRGYSLEEMLYRAIRHMENLKKRILLVLDDADLLFKLNPETIYLFTRLYETLPHTRIVSPLFTIESMETLRESDSKIVSTLRRNLILLKDYSREQLRDILKDRVEEAFLPGAVPTETLNECVETTSNTNSDLSYAFAVLRRGGEIAESQEKMLVSPEHLRTAVGELPPSPLFNELDRLSLQEKLILFSLYSLVKSRGLDPIPMGTLTDQYRELCIRFDVKPIGHTWLWRNVNVLSQLGFISLRISGKGRRGKTTLISPTITPAESVYKRLSFSLRRERFLV